MKVTTMRTRGYAPVVLVQDIPLTEWESLGALLALQETVSAGSVNGVT